MIVTLTLNPALDITYTVPELMSGTTHRPRVRAQAGGKGVNVARTLHALGRETVAVLPLGGYDGSAVRAELDASGVPHLAIPIAGATRRTVTVVEESGLATGFNESGPELGADEWAEICVAVAALLETAVLDGAAVLVLSGKLPRGLADDAYADLITLADAFGVPTILDTEGAPLLAALSARPAIVKPNAHELLDATGLADPVAAAGELLKRGASAVVSSNGPDGLTALTAEGTWTARPPRVDGGNPTGAGDASVAALAVGLATGLITDLTMGMTSGLTAGVTAGPAVGSAWPDVLADAAALSAATVLTDRAGVFDAEAYRRFRSEISAQREDFSAPRED